MSLPEKPSRRAGISRILFDFTKQAKDMGSGPYFLYLQLPVSYGNMLFASCFRDYVLRCDIN